MKITVKLFATLRENREKEELVEVSEGTAVRQIIEMLKIPVEEVAIIMVNGRGVKVDTQLEEADVLALFPPVGGG